MFPFFISFENNCSYTTPFEGAHLTLPPYIISVEVKSWSMLHHGSVEASLKQNKRNLKTLTLNVLLPSIIFHYKIYVFIIIFTAFSFYGLFTTYLLYEEVMSGRLYAFKEILARIKKNKAKESKQVQFSTLGATLSLCE